MSDVQLTSSDPNRTLVDNYGRSKWKRLAIKIDGNEIQNIDDYDMLMCWYDLWKTSEEHRNLIQQSIIENSGGQTSNCIKHRIGAGDKTNNVEDQALAKAYSNKFSTPLDFEMLFSSMPFHQSGLIGQLTYELTANDYSKVIKSSRTGTGANEKPADGSYKESGISLEFEVIKNSRLAQEIKSEYQQTIMLYDRILRHRHIRLDNTQTVWNMNFNTPAKSLKGILMLFTKEKDWSRNTEKYINPEITNVKITVEGVPNQLYAQGMKMHHQFEECMKHFGGDRLKKNDHVIKELNLSHMKAIDYYTKNYGLWLEFRSTDDGKLHGSGRRIENASEGITTELDKNTGTGTARLLCALVYGCSN